MDRATTAVHVPDCFLGVEDTDLRKVARTYAPLLKRTKASADKLDGGLIASAMNIPSYKGKVI